MPKSIIISPLLSEKAQLMMFDKQNNPTGYYVFKVRKDATKMAIKQEIEKLYGVEVETVNTIVVPRKRKIFRSRVRYSEGWKSGWKKAYIKLSRGIIPIFEELQPVEDQSKARDFKKEDKQKDKQKEKEKKK
ncbi:MAG: 50S ribosomal protein L23 [Brevinematales bacterium]|nr:50S ribosomal protein L23 [Brevinematales bacterium]